MKKILSVILSACLLASLLPANFLLADESFTDEIVIRDEIILEDGTAAAEVPGEAADGTADEVPEGAEAEMADTDTEVVIIDSGEGSGAAADEAAAEEITAVEEIAEVEDGEAARPESVDMTGSDTVNISAATGSNAEEDAGQVFFEGTVESEPAEDGAVAVVSGYLPVRARAVIKAVSLTQEELVQYFGEEKAAEMGSFAAYDIKILVNGEIWQPDETVSVTIRQPAIETKDSEGIGGLHVDSRTGSTDALDTRINEEGDVSFSAESFSLFIFFTVDFYNEDGLGYCLMGRESILLSELLAILEYDFRMDQISEVTFSDPALLAVEPVENDWLLTSLEPFDTEEHLYITLLNGETVDIFVLDDQTAEGGKDEKSEEDVSYDKVGDPVEGKHGEYEVTLTVTGRAEEEEDKHYTDVVLVMDVTSSVGKGMKDEKAAAKDLINTLLKDDNSMARVALVQFTDMKYSNGYYDTQHSKYCYESKYLNSTTDNGSYFYTHSNYEKALAQIDTLPDNSNNVHYGSTNIQLGLMMAERIIDSDECKKSKPVVILLTDGAPNRAVCLEAGSTNSLKYTLSSHSSYHADKVGSGGTTSYSGNPDEANYYNTFPNEDLSKYEEFSMGEMHFQDPFNADGTVNSAQAGKIERESQLNPVRTGSNAKINWICSCGNVTDKSGSGSLGLVQQTYYASLSLKSKAELYTVGVKLKTKQIKTFIAKMATDETHSFVIDDFDKLKDTIADIAHKIQNVATGVSVADTMSEQVDLIMEGAEIKYTTSLQDYQDGKSDVYISSGSLTYDKSTETIKWIIGDLPYGAVKEMRYRVKIKAGVTGTDIPLNKEAVLSYTDANGETKQEDFPVPQGEAEEEKVTISYVALEAKGSVSPASEEVEQTGTAAGSTATPNPGYKLTGWYAEESCTTLLSTDSHFVPSKDAVSGKYAEASYYAKFEAILGSLTVTKTGCQAADSDQSFIFWITGTSLADTGHDPVDMYVTVQGNGSVTITNLPVGTYSVKEVASWSWRYTPKEDKTVAVTEDGAAAVVENSRTKKTWFSGSSHAVNTAAGRKQD